MKLPEPVENLYRDLRDKNLLPIVGLLLVLLIAIPVLLGGGSEPAAPTGSASSADLGTGAEEAPEASAVVLAEVPGIRDYKKRLDSFDKKNPFRQQLTKPPKAVKKALEESEKELENAVEEAIEAGAAEGGGTGGGGSDPGTGGNPPDQGPDGYLLTIEIDAKVGVVGDSKKKKGVKSGEFLPGEKRPVVMFLDGNETEGVARFIVSSNVSKSTGEGRCIPDKVHCEYLELKVGEEQRFVYEPDGRTYRLKLSSVDLVKTPQDFDDLEGLRAEGSSASPLAGVFEK